MDQIVIQGGKPLKGEIRISGAKNAALPLMAASLLTEETLSLSNVPHLADISTMARLLAQHGVNLHMNGGAENGSNGGVLELRAERITSVVAPYDLVRKMRASVLVLGPILAREGRAQVSLPGGCAIGTRPVDLHLNGLELLGAEIDLKEGYIYAAAPGGLVGAPVVFPKVSVGATENLLMAACLAKGETQLLNAAREPEVIDLGECLIKMGAEIEGLGSDRITIRGVERMQGAEHSVVADRIETGTYAMAAAITNGELDLIGGRADHLSAVIKVLTEAGIEVQETNRGLKVRRANGQVHGVDVMTEPYPGFPTDLQAQTMALMSTAEGASMITESIFENRFMHVPELTRMGANVNVHGASAMVRGQQRLTGAEVMATDLRASVSLVLAGLAAEGETVLNRVYHLDRGYERLEQKLAACGAEIARRQASG
ncbi:UDP-N-acetylglucosamine 1-carboxyvinyltransferase [Pelagibius litoralis]|uniref:UDP-N-acetylglucosamine 1-carboxyvinyltransferase n=1 Tax=Pelagibius litoralis TaxID=374515 RepID=A0A967F0N7_9PROT|nr:UDP-N-acetylglucosamine 1-carboxyvinyltransferase [Pelagibius litoralis]NIA70840.1 UDP-N-acetylglucosamine 1-carboxyvinyltransferase [Pelagibius litoralis]